MNDRIKAVIFDMDGVLVDSEPVIAAAAIAGLSEFGVEAKHEDFTPFVGAGEDRFIGGVAEKYGVPYRLEMKERVYQIYLEKVNDEIGLYEGIAELLEELKHRGLQLALASSADMIKIDANLNAAGISHDLFDIVLSGNDVEHKKPHPEIYQRACRDLKVDAGSALVVEDALNGVEAAKAAGCQCCGVTSFFSEDRLKSAGADFVVEETRAVKDLLT